MVYVIIGNGPAGVSAIEHIRQNDQQGKIILISKEDNPPYSRIMTPEYMTGEVSEEDLFLKGSEFYQEFQVKTHLGRTVEQIFPKDNRVVLDNDEEIIYDQLLIASGSRPLIPAWVDLKIKGVFTLWDKRDSERIKAYLRTGVREAVIVGGGLVGLQAARALKAYGINITIIERMDRLMPMQLDQTAGSMIVEWLKRNDIKILLNTEVTSLSTENGQIAAVRIEGQDIPADLVLFSTGIRPNLGMIKDSGLEIKQGVIVNQYMQTNVPNIYAAGDVAEAFCQLTGDHKLRALWPCAVQQGKVAGANMTGRQESYHGSIAMNSFQLFGLSVLSFGQIEAQEGMEEKFLHYPSSGIYQKLILKDGKLQGLIFVGDIQQAGILFPKIGQSLQEGFYGTIPLNDVDKIGVEYAQLLKG